MCNNTVSRAVTNEDLTAIGLKYDYTVVAVIKQVNKWIDRVYHGDFKRSSAALCAIKNINYHARPQNICVDIDHYSYATYITVYMYRLNSASVQVHQYVIT